MNENSDPVGIVNALGALWSPDFDAYASGRLDPSRLRCALCSTSPCECPEFGTSEYIELVTRRHGLT